MSPRFAGIVTIAVFIVGCGAPASQRSVNVPADRGTSTAIEGDSTTDESASGRDGGDANLEPAVHSSENAAVDPAIANAPDPSGREQRGPRTYELDGLRLHVEGVDAAGEPIIGAYDARSLLDTANDAFVRHDLVTAERVYRQLLDEFPADSPASAARYNLGLVAEEEGDIPRAIAAYRDLVAKHPTGHDSLEGHIRIAALLAETLRFAESVKVLDEVLARNDLTNGDRVEVHARRGYAYLEQRDYPAAEAALRQAIVIHGKALRTESSYFIAMAHYYLAEIPHRQMVAIELKLPSAMLSEGLRVKADLAVLAYDRFKAALGFRSAYWATAAGYQMSQMYKELWDDIVSAPIPPELDPEAIGAYRTEVHRRSLEFLEKAMDGHTRNVELAEAYRVDSVWAEASRTRAVQIAMVVAEETAGRLSTPSGQGAPPGVGAAAGDFIPGPVEL